MVYCDCGCVFLWCALYVIYWAGRDDNCGGGIRTVCEETLFCCGSSSVVFVIICKDDRPGDAYTTVVYY